MLSTLAFVIFETKESYHLSDESLVRHIKNDDEQAFETLTAKMKMLIFSVISKHNIREHEELYQDAIILLYQTALQYDEEKCDSFKPFYLKMLDYRIKDWLRKKKSIQKIEMLSLDAPCQEDGRLLKEEIDDPTDLTPEEQSIYNDMITHINPVSLCLSPFEYRLAKQLIDGYTLQDIAKHEKRNINAIYGAHRRLKEKVILHLMR